MLTRRRVLAAKIESTPGTAQNLSAADAAMNVFDAKMDPQVEYEERDGQGVFSPLPGVLGARGGQCTFQVELSGSGAAGTPPKWAQVLLPCCGMALSGGQFTPESIGPSAGGNVKTCTIGLYEDGMVKKLRGCMGNAVFQFVAGKVVRVEFTMTGIWIEPSDVAILSPNYPTISPLRFADADLTIASWSPVLAELTLDLGNEVVLREDASQVQGYISAIITARRMNGSLNPETTLVATHDAFGQWLNYTEQTLNFVLGGASASGNRVEFTAPKMQFTNLAEADRNGIQANEIQFQLNRSASAGDDELTINF